MIVTTSSASSGAVGDCCLVTSPELKAAMALSPVQRLKQLASSSSSSTRDKQKLSFSTFRDSFSSRMRQLPSTAGTAGARTTTRTLQELCSSPFNQSMTSVTSKMTELLTDYSSRSMPDGGDDCGVDSSLRGSLQGTRTRFNSSSAASRERTNTSTNNTNHKTKNKKKTKKNLRVGFAKALCSVRIVEPYFPYAEDLWYKKSDDGYSQPGLTTVADIARAQMYLNSYAQARKEVDPQSSPTSFPSAGNDTTASSASAEGYRPSPSKPNLLSSRLYEELVVGRTHGFAGLEHFSDEYGKRSRRFRVRQIVVAIVSVYYDAANNNNNNNNNGTNKGTSTTMDGTDHTSTAPLTCDERWKKVRSCAKSLTSVDRYWATALGSADQEAAAQVYREDGY